MSELHTSTNNDHKKLAKFEVKIMYVRGLFRHDKMMWLLYSTDIPAELRIAIAYLKKEMRQNIFVVPSVFTMGTKLHVLLVVFIKISITLY